MEDCNLIRFDWAIKRLLRQKANFVVLEGLLTSLLDRPIRIVRMLESEGNKESDDDKFNRVDMLAEDNAGEMMIIEVQNNRELDYFHRMLYGTSKVITEYLKEGDDYAHIKKVYSINIVYFDLGQGEDFVYHGTTEFEGVHCHDVLRLSARQRAQFKVDKVGDIYPEYYVLRVEKFNKVATCDLEEWISFLKTGEIPAAAKAPGLQEARERLRADHMSPTERRAYKAHIENLRYQRSVISTGRKEGWDEGRAEGEAKGRAEGEAKGRAEGKAEGLAEGEAKAKRDLARNLLKDGMPIEKVAALTGLPPAELKNQ